MKIYKFKAGMLCKTVNKRLGFRAYSGVGKRQKTSCKSWVVFTGRDVFYGIWDHTNTMFTNLQIKVIPYTKKTLSQLSDCERVGENKHFPTIERALFYITSRETKLGQMLL